MIIDNLVYLTFILYSINMNIYFYFLSTVNSKKRLPFFKMITDKNISIDKFMEKYRNYLVKSNYFFIFMGCLLLIRSLFF